MKISDKLKPLIIFKFTFFKVLSTFPEIPSTS
jgi:hypothetical protein